MCFMNISCIFLRFSFCYVSFFFHFYLKSFSITPYSSGAYWSKCQWIFFVVALFNLQQQKLVWVMFFVGLESLIFFYAHIFVYRNSFHHKKKHISVCNTEHYIRMLLQHFLAKISYLCNDFCFFILFTSFCFVCYNKNVEKTLHE